MTGKRKARVEISSIEQSTQLRPGTASYGSGLYELIVRNLTPEQLKRARAAVRAAIK